YRYGARGGRMRTIIDVLRRARDDVRSAGRASRQAGGLNRCDLSRWLMPGLTAVALVMLPAPASRAADNEIRIGNTIPYSGPAAAYGIIGKTIAAYFNRINDQGGINGRRINFISYDDGY